MAFANSSFVSTPDLNKLFNCSNCSIKSLFDELIVLVFTVFLIIEKTGLIVADTETLIRHYDKTLESWLERFLDKKKEVKDLFDEKFVKMWEFYMSSVCAAFRYRDLVVFQLQIVKNFQAAHRTRDYIYKT